MQTAIEHALTVLGWYEHLSKDEVPPQHLWEDSQGLDRWWRDVEDRRNEKYGLDPTPSRSDSGNDQEHPDSGMAENDIARAFRE